MYEKHFNLRERPFALSPDPDYLYPSRVHQEALSYLRYGIEGHAGFVVITGEIGSGKTTMLQSLVGRIDRNTAVARIVNTILEPRELLDAIMLDFGMDPSGMSKPALLHKLAEFLVQQRQAGRLTLLVIDEAQNLTLPALEEIRMLSNLETEKSKLIQIIMVGQPELREKLRLPHLEQLRQRITVSYHLQPLDEEETTRYINHRLARAAIGAPLEFPREVTSLIHQRSRGVPRIINVIADATLLFAYGLDRRDIDTGVATEALAELDATGVLASYHSESVQAATATSVSVSEAAEAMRLADSMRRRETEIVDRERHLREREVAVAAQQRVLEEQTRLLAAARATRPPAPIAAPPPSSGIAPPRSRAAALTGGSSSLPTRSAATSPTANPMAQAAGSIVPSRNSAIGPPRGVPMGAPSTAGTMAPAGSTAAPAGAAVLQGRVRVQPYPQPIRLQQHIGLWERLRRVLFGVTEPEAGA